MKILIIDDDPHARIQVMDVLQADGTEFVEVSQQDGFDAAVSLADFDLVITEYRLSWSDGLSLLKQLKAKLNCVPVIMFTGYGDTEIAVEGMKNGLADYLSKPHYSRLKDAVGRFYLGAEFHDYCKYGQKNILLCEKWDLAISRLTSDFAYSIRIKQDGRLENEWVTDTFRRITGYRSGETALDSGWLVPIYPEDISVFQQWFKQLLAGEQSICEYRIITKKGDVRWLRDHALPVRNYIENRIVRIYGAAQDVTDRRNAENILRIKQRALECSNNGIVITGLADTDFGITYANPAFQRMTGYSMEELLGRNCRMLQDKDREQEGIENLREAILHDCDGYSVLRNYRKDGRMFWNEIYISPVVDQNEKVTHYVGVQNDITDRKRSEEEQRRLYNYLQIALEAERTRISREIHDEFGSLLATLRLDVRWLEKRIAADQINMHEKFSQMSQLIDIAMQTVRKISTELRPSMLDNLGLLAAIEWQVSQFRMHAGFPCDLTMPPQDKIAIDSDRATVVFRILQESLTNILLHACASHAAVEIQVNEQALVMRITDNGLGTFQENASGVHHGILGMTERARHFGGDLQITGKPGQGTALLLRLPLTNSVEGASV